MKNIFSKAILISLLGVSLALTSCEDYLSILPKGEKIPATLQDFEALLRDEYSCQKTDVTQAVILLNDRFVSSMYVNYYPYWGANYNWDESANRVEMNNSDETTYYNTYAAISSCNLIIENAPGATEATEEEKNEVIAYAKVIRSMCYYVLTNYYADTYDASTASTKLSVPLITSAEVGAAYTQVTIQKMYDFIISNVEDVIEAGYLPETGMTILHPNLGAAYAFLARVYLQMDNYTKALEYANLALGQNDELFDWTAYYATYQSQIENASSYVTTPSPFGYDYVENYNYRHGATSYSSSENNLLVERAARFETGDARFAARWKYYTVGSDTYYKSTTSGYFNYGGMTTVEVYLIKAECLARAGQYQDAMDILNDVRKTRILASGYADLTATTEAQAIENIRRTKDNEMIFSIVPFADARRFNKETAYARTMTKVVDGETKTLSPTSHLWTMPFPMGAIKNHGNGTITQNVEN
jgi:starch-binding outer membrane protein, SusD/RagB family